MEDINGNNECPQCELVSRGPNTLSHEAGPCTWPSLAGVCPDCGRDGEQCTFFSRNKTANACTGITRLLVLSLCCEREGARIRTLPAMRNRVVNLSGGPNSEGADFALTHVDAYSNGVKRMEGVFVPLAIGSPDTPFWLDCSGASWRVYLGEKAGADRFTMHQLLSTLKTIEDGSDAEDPDEETRPPKDKEEASREASSEHASESRLERLEKMMEQLLVREVPSANVRAAAALDAAQAIRVESPRATGARQNPNVLYDLSVRGNQNVVSNMSTGAAGDDVALVQALSAAKVPPETIVEFLRSRSRPSEPTRHRDLWASCFEGTSPLRKYTSMKAETRQGATPRKEMLEAYETPTSQQKRKMTFVSWPPTAPDKVSPYTLAELGDYWAAGLREANQRVQAITPPADLGLAPVVPTGVEVFLARLQQCFTRYDHSNVLRAWESAHNQMIDQYVRGDKARGDWEDVLRSPVFLAELGPVASPGSAAGAAKPSRNPGDYCNNWNLRAGRNCSDTPAESCKKRHRCLVCDGEHRLLDCSRRE